MAVFTDKVVSAQFIDPPNNMVIEVLYRENEDDKHLTPYTIDVDFTQEDFQSLLQEITLEEIEEKTQARLKSEKSFIEDVIEKEINKRWEAEGEKVKQAYDRSEKYAEEVISREYEKIDAEYEKVNALYKGIDGEYEKINEAMDAINEEYAKIAELNKQINNNWKELEKASNQINEEWEKLDKTSTEAANQIDAEYQKINEASREINLEYEKIRKAGEEINAEYEKLSKASQDIESEYNKIDKHFQVINKEYRTIGQEYQTLQSEFKKVESDFKRIDLEYENIDTQFNILNTEFKKVGEEYVKIDREYQRADEYADIQKSKKLHEVQEEFQKLRDSLASKFNADATLTTSGAFDAKSMIRSITAMNDDNDFVFNLKVSILEDPEISKSKDKALKLAIRKAKTANELLKLYYSKKEL